MKYCCRSLKITRGGSFIPHGCGWLFTSIARQLRCFCCCCAASFFLALLLPWEFRIRSLSPERIPSLFCALLVSSRIMHVQSPSYSTHNVYSHEPVVFFQGRYDGKRGDIYFLIPPVYLSIYVVSLDTLYGTIED